jgi:hypothetical protein
MGRERHLRRKLTLRAHGEQVVFVKRKQERIEHVWMKAFLWALYLPSHPDLCVEVSIGAKYKPDVVAMDALRGRPRFWGEAGHVSADKIAHLVQQYPRTHFALGKWATALDPFIDLVADAMDGVSRSAPFDLIRFPDDSAERFLDAKGHITMAPDALDRHRLGGGGLTPGSRPRSP